MTNIMSTAGFLKGLKQNYANVSGQYQEKSYEISTQTKAKLIDITDTWSFYASTVDKVSQSRIATSNEIAQKSLSSLSFSLNQLIATVKDFFPTLTQDLSRGVAEGLSGQAVERLNAVENILNSNAFNGISIFSGDLKGRAVSNLATIEATADLAESPAHNHASRRAMEVVLDPSSDSLARRVTLSPSEKSIANVVKALALARDGQFATACQIGASAVEDLSFLTQTVEEERENFDHEIVRFKERLIEKQAELKRLNELSLESLTSHVSDQTNLEVQKNLSQDLLFSSQRILKSLINKR